MFTTERDPPVCLINLVDWYMMKYFPTSMRKFLKATFEGNKNRYSLSLKNCG
jgi:hypothetical protein